MKKQTREVFEDFACLTQTKKALQVNDLQGFKCPEIDLPAVSAILTLRNPVQVDNRKKHLSPNNSQAGSN